MAYTYSIVDTKCQTTGERSSDNAFVVKVICETKCNETATLVCESLNLREDVAEHFMSDYATAPISIGYSLKT
jgi:hypothetical protein